MVRGCGAGDSVGQEPYPAIPRALTHSRNSAHGSSEGEGWQRPSQDVLLTWRSGGGDAVRCLLYRCHTVGSLCQSTPLYFHLCAHTHPPVSPIQLLLKRWHRLVCLLFLSQS